MKQTTCVCVAIFAFGAATGCIATKQTYVSRGNKLYDAGKYADAALNYRKAIQKDPKFGEAYYRLGLAAIKQDQPREAYDSLYHAQQLLPNRVDVTEKFADVCLSYYLASPTHPQALYKQIADLSADLLAKNPSSYEGLMLKGYLFQTDRKPKDAIEYFRKALAINSADAGVATSLVQTLLQDGQTQEAEKLALNLIYRQKTSYGKIYDLMYSLYYQQNKVADAENVLKAKVSNNPTQAAWIVELAHHYQRSQKPAEMKATLQRLLDNPKDFPEGRAWVGDYYMGLRDYAEATHYYQEGLHASSNAKEKALYQNKTLTALLAQGKNDEASHLADQILAENSKDDDALRVRADLWMASNKTELREKALHAFQELSARKPNDARLRFHLGRVYERQGDLAAANNEFQQAIKLDPDFLEAKYELGVVYLMRKQPREALQQANAILAARPDYRPGKLLRTESLIRSGDTKTARKELSGFAKDPATDNQVQFQMALLALSDRKFPEALDILNGLRSSGDPQVFVGLASIYTSRREFDKAFATLEDGLKKSGESVAIHNQMAITAVLSRQFDRSILEFQKVLAMDPKSVETMRLIADVYELKGDQEDAIKMYRKAYDTAPNSVPSALALASALAQAGRAADARALYMGIAKSHPEDPVVLNNTAYVLADTGGDLDEALRLAKSALEKSPKQDAYSDTIGYVYLKKGLKDSAVQTFKGLVRKNPHFPAFRYHLGLALYEKGDKTAARLELQTALADHPGKQDEQRIRELLKKLGAS